MKVRSAILLPLVFLIFPLAASAQNNDTDGWLFDWELRLPQQTGSAGDSRPPSPRMISIPSRNMFPWHLPTIMPLGTRPITAF